LSDGAAARVGVDIGGTFTDVALEVGERRYTAKVLTRHDAPEQGVLCGLREALQSASLAPSDLSIFIYGTTLVTNLLIERKGAPTALLTTLGFRDSLEMRSENRYEQYDLNIELPPPLVPRALRFPVAERMSARGEVLVPIDEAQVEALVPALEREQVQSLAVGFLHSYRNPAHEERAREILRAQLPALEITLSCEVSPEMREYERLSTACANAYVQPLMSRHLRSLEQVLNAEGVRCPVFLMLSGGGITTLETAIRFPVRLVESGPAGGAIFAAHIARTLGLRDVVSYDMGGTTAKLCLIDDAQPQNARAFEVARVYRFMKGSGLPLRIPVIEMVEIGAGGGSIAAVDALQRITVGPQSAGSAPGPACYARGGEAPTVTDADLVLGRLDPHSFAGGTLPLDRAAAQAALARGVGDPLELSVEHAALGVSEMVDENMSSAARMHAIESGKLLGSRTLVAFGGAAPLHAARVAAKLGICRVVVPPGAGVGSAIGFLRAPVAYEVTRSHYQRLGALNVAATNALIAAMRAEARAVVERGAGDRELFEQRTAYMRYVGQGHDVGVEIPVRVSAACLGQDASAALRAAFEAEYHRLYARTIPDLEIEILTWVVRMAARVDPVTERPHAAGAGVAKPSGERVLLDPSTGHCRSVPVYERADLPAGALVDGPAVIAERDTATIVSSAFRAHVHPLGHLILERRS
jgi:N-methylhydantoinase A